MSDLDIRQLVRQDSVHRSVYTSPAVFELEMARIFEGSWIFVGHASQVPNPGDYIVTTMGRQSVIMVRHKDGSIRVLYNRCAHKGAQLALSPGGHVRQFRCGYHGWVFDTDGTVLHIPLEEGYQGTAFEKGCALRHVQPVGAVDEYRGFVFGSLNPNVPPLLDWLAGCQSSIDNMVDRAPDGELEVAGGVMRYRHNSNWKFFIENLNDLMHAIVAHHSSSDTAKRVGKQVLGEDGAHHPTIEILSPFTAQYSFFDKMGLQTFKHGHSFSGRNISIHSAYSDIPGYQAAMEAAYGAERTREIFSTNRHNTIYYPNLTIKGAIQTARVVKPVSVDETIIETYQFRLKGAPDALLERTIHYSNLVNSAANLVGPDDYAQYRRMQEGLETQANDWVSLHRYLNADEVDEKGRHAVGTSDLAFRNQFDAWLELMDPTSESGAAHG
jgi:benzoate/toluate 1,2-dioxygenase subunit alpha